MDAPTFGILGQYTNLIFGGGGIALLFIFYFIGTYNSIVNAKNTTEESLSAIDTVLQNRYNLIPNLVEVVKQYMAHEAGVLTKIAELRSSVVSSTPSGSKERFAKENELQGALKSIFAVAENYPDLKASTNFLELQTQWTEIEDRLQGARRAYNSNVKVLKNKKEMFPSNIVASMVTIPEFAMFEADEAAKTATMDAKEMFKA